MSKGAPHPLAGLAGSECLRTFTDNVLRTVVVFLLIAQRQREADVQAAAALVNIAYVVPWIVLSIWAGVLADRVSKRSIFLGLKLAEIGVMALTIVTIPAANPIVLVACVALVGTIGALASPCRYGILPELLPRERLSAGMGLILLASYVAIPVGVAAGGWLLDALRDRTWTIGFLLFALACVGFAFTWRIPRVPAARNEGGVRQSVLAAWLAVSQNPRLRLAFLGDVAYWMLAAFLSQNVIVYSKSILLLSDTDKARVLAMITLGIGLGAAAAGKLSRDRIAWHFLPWSVAAMAGVTFLFGFLVPGYGGTVLLCLGLGIAAGFYLLPVNALIQAEAPPGLRGAVLAAINVIGFAGIAVGSAASWALADAGLSSPTILLLSAAVTACGAVYAFVRVPRVMGPVSARASA